MGSENALAELASVTSLSAGVLRRADLDRHGFSSREIATLVRVGSLTRIHRGVYRVPVPGERPSDRFRAKVRAVLTLDPGRVLTGSAAATALGLPVHHDARDVHVAVDGRGGSSARSAVRTVAAPPASQLVEVAGGQVAGPARAALDAARLESVVAGVVIADAALGRGLAAADDLREVLDGMRGLAGVGRSRLCAELASGRSESPGESWSAVVMHAYGIPRAERQQAFVDEAGPVGRVDFWWAEQRLVGEFDGRVTCGRSNPSGRPPEDILWDEKIREDRLRALGLRVVRWTAADLHSPAPWIRRLNRALAA